MGQKKMCNEGLSRITHFRFWVMTEIHFLIKQIDLEYIAHTRIPRNSSLEPSHLGTQIPLLPWPIGPTYITGI